MKSITKEQYKQENKKALKILVPITIAAGVFGGVIGVMASMHGAQGLAETFSNMLHQFLYIIGPWAVILSSLIGIFGGLFILERINPLEYNWNKNSTRYNFQYSCT